AHPHQYDVGDLAFPRRQKPSVVGTLGAGPVADAVACQHDLSDDFFGFEIAHEALRAGMTERAGEGAADLARNAKRAATALGDVDGFDFRWPSFVSALGKPEQPLACAVDGDLLRNDFQPVERVEAFEVAAEILRDVRHVVEARDAAHVYPAPELGGAHVELLCRNARSSERRLQLVARQAR